MPIDEGQLGPAIERAGYKYIDGSGYGATALWKPVEWTGPNGDTPVDSIDSKTGKPYAPQTQEQIANDLFPSSSPYLAANNKPEAKAPGAPDSRYLADGTYQEWNGKQWVTDPQGFNPTKAAGYRAPTAGPAPKSALDIEQQQVGIEASRAAIEASKQAIATAQATIERNARLDAQAAAQQSWLTQKDMLAAANDDKRTQATVAAQLATIQNQRDMYAFTVQQAQQRAQEAQQSLALDVLKTNAAGQERVSEFNATQGLATQQANNAAAAQKQRDIADANDKIGVLGQDTGNRGRFASFVTANRGFGHDNTAIGQGTSLIDNTSAQPLENSLVNKQNILARPDNPYTFTPLAFNPLTVPTIQGPLSMPAPATPTTPGTAPVAATPTAGVDYSPGAMQARIDASRAAGSGAGGGMPLMEHGGTVQGAYMSGDSSDGEENPEINIPLGNRGAMVISLKGMPTAKVKALKAKMQKFATGGLFDQLDSSPLSQQFLGDASAKFREGTPWAGKTGALPSPVYQSSPGFNPTLGALLNSGRALEQGIPTEYSSWLAQRYAPNTINGPRIVSRTA